MEQDIIIFDFDNTLVNSIWHWKRAINRDTFRYFHARESTEFKNNHGAKSNIELAEYFLEITKVNATPAEVLRVWYDYMFVYYTKKVKFINGAIEFIKHLKEQGKKVVLASATGDALLYPVLRELKIDSLFDTIVTENEIGYSKRDPMFFAKLLKKLNTTPEEVFLFEDSYYSIFSAASVRIQSCAVLGKYNKKHKERLKEISLLVIKDYTDPKLKLL